MNAIVLRRAKRLYISSCEAYVNAGAADLYCSILAVMVYPPEPLSSSKQSFTSAGVGDINDWVRLEINHRFEIFSFDMSCYTDNCKTKKTSLALLQIESRQWNRMKKRSNSKRWDCSIVRKFLARWDMDDAVLSPPGNAAAGCDNQLN